MRAPNVVAIESILSRVTRRPARTAAARLAAGASALQVFDSWVGALAPDTYRASVQPHMRRLFDEIADLGVPTIHFGVGTGNYSFVWSMGGENQAFDDMDAVAVDHLA